MENPFLQIHNRLANIEAYLIKNLKEPTPPPPPQSERYLTKKQVCELMQISPVCVHNYEKRGILKRVEFGGLPRFRLSDIEKSLDGLTNRKK